jgi:phosphoribosylformylglycinamidine synthase
MKPKVCILRSDGTNCDQELYYAFEKFGSAPEYVHVNELRNKTKKMNNFQILALPGGFSYGDDLASGKILAIELVSFLKNQLEEFINKKGLILGVCNGFQTLVRTGLLPYNHIGKMDVTLTQNKNGHFECRWVKVKIEKSKCLFLKQTDQILDIAVNHGEGNFFAGDPMINKIEKDQLVTVRYVDKNGRPINEYPQNPNGSINAIAGICDLTGRILGLMPHPEKFVDITQHPNWRREKFLKPHGAYIFESLIKYANQT